MLVSHSTVVVFCCFHFLGLFLPPMSSSRFNKKNMHASRLSEHHPPVVVVVVDRGKIKKEISMNASQKPSKHV